MINKEDIFKLFDEECDAVDKIPPRFEDIYNIGMFIKIIQNYKVFYKKLEKFLKEEGGDYDENIKKTLSKSAIYNRSWFYIGQVNIDENLYKEVLYKYNYSQLFQSLDSSILFFEALEEYEKCAHLYKIKKYLEEGKNSLED